MEHYQDLSRSNKIPSLCPRGLNLPNWNRWGLSTQPHSFPSTAPELISARHLPPPNRPSSTTKCTVQPFFLIRPAHGAFESAQWALKWLVDVKTQPCDRANLLRNPRPEMGTHWRDPCNWYFSCLFHANNKCSHSPPAQLPIHRRECGEGRRRFPFKLQLFFSNILQTWKIEGNHREG